MVAFFDLFFEKKKSSYNVSGMICSVGLICHHAIRSNIKLTLKQLNEPFSKHVSAANVKAPVIGTFKSALKRL